MSNSIYTYISNIYDLVWFGLVLWHINYCRLFNVLIVYIDIVLIVCIFCAHWANEYNVINLTLDEPCRFVDFKNRMHLWLKVNKRQWKYHVNCVGGILEGRVITRCVGVWKICNDGSFQPQGSEQWVESRERLDIMLFWVLAWQESR